MFKKAIDTAVPVHEIIADRWSGRAFDPQRPVAHDTLLTLLEAARWAPSCFGDQPWRLLIWDREANGVAWQDAAACLAESNRAWASAAPILTLVCASRYFSHNGEPNRWAEYDTGAAALALSIQASASGLMVHQMGGFNRDEIQKRFAIPSEFTPMAMLAIGYQVSKEQVPDSFKEREFAPRSRRSLEESFFFEYWGKGVKL